MKKLFKKWWFWVIVVAVVLCIGLSSNNEEGKVEVQKDETTVITEVDLTAECIKQLSTYENITVDAVDIFVEVIPNFTTEFDYIDQEGTVLSHVFNLYLKDGTRYIVVTFAGGDFLNQVATIMSSEEDPNLRTRYYNVVVKDNKLVSIL